jgi:putative sterol carrier protein
MAKSGDLLVALVERFRPEEADGFSAIYQLNLSGDDGGTWYLSVANRQCSLDTGISSHPDVTITVSAQDWVDLLSGKLDGYTAFFQGRVDVQGDLALVLRLQEMFGF